MGLKAMFFTTDALLAAFLIMAVLIAASSFYLHEPAKEDISFFAQDLINVIPNLMVGDINDSYVQSLIAQGNITRLNNSLLEQVAAFWAEGKTSQAAALFDNVIGPLVPEGLSIGVWIDNNLTYESNRSSGHFLSSFRKFVSGIEHDKPVEGFTSRIYLKGIDSRHTAAFGYFGGFVGQGNLTRKLALADNITSIEEVYLELDTSGNFSLYLNDHFVGNFLKGSGGGAYMRPDQWVIDSSHYSYLHSGYNIISIYFKDLGYVAGGFMRVAYNTNTHQDNDVTWLNNTASSLYWFPGIKGVLNLYDSIGIPGTLTAMDVYLKFKSTFPTYLTIGSTVVQVSNGSSDNTTVHLTNLSDYPYSLDFKALSNSTVPLRLASYNLSVSSITGSTADVILITDLSGSMRWKIGSWDEMSGVIRACNNPLLYSASDSRRVSVAKCLDINFTDSIMNSEGNREWLVDFEESAHYFSSNPADLTRQNLINRILSYTDNPSGGTCLCCAINLAYNILNTFTSNRSKYVVVLTDGIPTYCCGVTGHGHNQRCANGTSTSYQYSSDTCTGGQEDCNNNDCNGPRNNAIWSAQRLVNKFHAKVYTVGMGPIVGCRAANTTLKEIAQAGNGTFNASQNASQLRKIFQGIATSIQASVNQSNQQLLVMGNLTPSILYSDSYILVNYSPIVPAPEYGHIQVTTQSARFGNTISQGKLYLPSTASLLSLQTTSYSADKWTDNVSVFDGTSWKQAFSLADTFVDYRRLGDPFVVMVPAKGIRYDLNNTILVKTGTGPSNSTNGSAYNRLTYALMIRNSIGYSNVYATARGCNWSLSFDDGTNSTLKIPANYNGTKKCSYRLANFSASDAMDNAAYTLFSYLDFNSDGRLAVRIGQDDLVLDSIAVSEVPSMWGPSNVEVRVWK
jgi:hypothetical protein